MPYVRVPNCGSVIENKICTKCGENKPLEMYSKKRPGKLDSQCKTCVLMRSKKWALENKDRAIENAKRWYIENKEKVAKRGKIFYQQNKESIKIRHAEWRSKNPEKSKSYTAKWAAKNPELIKASGDKTRAKLKDYYAHRESERRAMKISRKPLWAEDFFIKEAYALARLRSEITGIKWNVDHIVPLRSKIVCGLHCEINLQVIEATMNNKKSNKWWPDMPEQVVLCR